MLAARITLPHFSVCSTMNWPNSAGELANGSAPNWATRALNVGLASAALTSVLRIAMISDGVLAGPTIPVGYDKYRRDFNKLIWQLASPKWNFDDATFSRSAAAFDNPDHVAIVIHNYRWRLGIAEGEVKYDDLEKRLATGPTISVPTITMEGDANGAPHLEPSAYAKKFTGKYDHRNITGGIGHNLPQEAPQAFAEAIVDISQV
jgi:pimeloyl-ACP methyl ester carboxylesterase